MTELIALIALGLITVILGFFAYRIDKKNKQKLNRNMVLFSLGYARIHLKFALIHAKALGSEAGVVLNLEDAIENLNNAKKHTDKKSSDLMKDIQGFQAATLDILAQYTDTPDNPLLLDAINQLITSTDSFVEAGVLVKT